jgi:hypothetical protein
MKTLTKIIGLGAVATIVGAIGWHALAQTPGPGFGPPFMHGPGMMGMRHDATTMTQMGVIHQLFAAHDRITRTVTNLPDGIRTVTESDDPQIAQLIKEHVGGMMARVGKGDDPGLPIESPALHAIFRDKDKIHTSVETTAKGIVAVQTSTDAKTVAALQQHASEVSDFVRVGMAARHTAMMKNGGMMGMGIHNPMMSGAPESGYTARK